MKFLATLLGILLIIFGTLLIPFPDYYNFQNQTITVDVKKNVAGETKAAKAEETTKDEATKEGENQKTEKKAESKKAVKGEVISVSLDPIIGAISVLVGIILVFMGRRVYA